MNHRIFASVAVALASMTGCNNLNTTVTVVALLPEQHQTVPPAATPEVQIVPVPWQPPAVPATNMPLVEPKKPNGSVQLCPVFRSPVLPKKPDLPLKEISAAGPNPARIQEIERQYIEDLHIYINQTLAALAKARAQYQIECKPYLKK